MILIFITIYSLLLIVSERAPLNESLINESLSVFKLVINETIMKSEIKVSP